MLNMLRTAQRAQRGLGRAALRPLGARGLSDRGGMTEAMYNWRVAAVENALKKMGKETGAVGQQGF